MSKPYRKIGGSLPTRKVDAPAMALYGFLHRLGIQRFLFRDGDELFEKL
jgi:hypothetical protein